MGVFLAHEKVGEQADRGQQQNESGQPDRRRIGRARQHLDADQAGDSGHAEPVPVADPGGDADPHDPVVGDGAHPAALRADSASADAVGAVDALEQEELGVLRAAANAAGAGARTVCRPAPAQPVSVAATAEVRRLVKATTASPAEPGASAGQRHSERVLGQMFTKQLDHAPSWVRPVLVALLFLAIVLLGLAALPEAALPGDRMAALVAPRRFDLALFGFGMPAAAAAAVFLF